MHRTMTLWENPRSIFTQFLFLAFSVIISFDRGRKCHEGFGIVPFRTFDSLFPKCCFVTLDSISNPFREKISQTFSVWSGLVQHWWIYLLLITAAGWYITAIKKKQKKNLWVRFREECRTSQIVSNVLYFSRIIYIQPPDLNFLQNPLPQFPQSMAEFLRRRH